MQKAATGKIQVGFITGEAGIGKTRLAEEFLAYVQAQGGAVITARCYEGETNLAFAPFMAGVGKMNYLRFLSYDVAGAVGWVTSMTVLGYYLGSIPLVRRHFEKVVILIIVAAVAFIWKKETVRVEYIDERMS